MLKFDLITNKKLQSNKIIDNVFKKLKEERDAKKTIHDMFIYFEQKSIWHNATFKIDDWKRQAPEQLNPAMGKWYGANIKEIEEEKIEEEKNDNNEDDRSEEQLRGPSFKSKGIAF